MAPNYNWPNSTAGRVSLVATGSVWKYLDDGSDQMTAWRGTNFDDSAWVSGPARLGYGNSGQATVVNSGPTNNYYVTTYFRRAFVVTNTSLFPNLTLRLLREDGGVVYLNGVVVFRSNMPATGTILFDTPALSRVPAGDKTTNFYSRTVSPSILANGTNLLAVEIHQASPNTPDLTFDLELIGIGNALPSVSLSGPTNGAVLGTVGNLPLNALAGDEDGQVRKVEFYLGNFKLGEDTNGPFGLNWTNAPEGDYTLTAVATDSGGARATSAPVNITLFASLVSTGSVWKYLDTGSNLLTAWRGSSFDAGLWASGPGQLGYGDGDEATVVNGGPTTNHFITTYFRRHFPANNPSSYTNLLLRVMRDDGAAVYLNGKEVFRSNMPNGPIAFNALASSTVSGADESTFFATNVSPGLLFDGTNLLAVEIHQVSPTSSDISFDLELLGLRPAPPPRLLLKPSGNTALLEWSAFAQAFGLQSSADLGSTDWAWATNAIAVTNARNSIMIALTNSGGFYRLKKS